MVERVGSRSRVLLLLFKSGFSGGLLLSWYVFKKILSGLQVGIGVWFLALVFVMVARGYCLLRKCVLRRASASSCSVCWEVFLRILSALL